MVFSKNQSPSSPLKNWTRAAKRIGDAIASRRSSQRHCVSHKPQPILACTIGRFATATDHLTTQEAPQIPDAFDSLLGMIFALPHRDYPW